MPDWVFKNKPPAYATLAVDSGTSGSTLTLHAGHGARLPAPGAGQISAARIEDELITYTGNSGDVLTGVIRGAGAVNHLAGTEVKNVLIEEWANAVTVLSTDTKAALAGTSGTPQATNKFVTDSDSRNSNARPPTAHGHVESDTTGLVADLAARVLGTDSRLSDARTPTAHAVSHKASGGDVLAGVVGGFAPLSSGLLVPTAYLGTGTQDATTVLRGDGTWGTVPGGGGGGTVTSVALTVPGGFAVSGSPVTGAGTLAVTESTQSANTVKAGPPSGGAATPGYRVLVAADLPNTAVTPGSYTNLSGTVDAQGRITAASNGTGGSGGALTQLAQTIVGSGGAASITFSAIPGTFTHLLLKLRGRGTATATEVWVTMQLNGDTGSNYDTQYQQLFATTMQAQESLGATSFSNVVNLPAASSPAGASGHADVSLTDYATANWHKGYSATGGNRLSTGTQQTRAVLSSGVWRSTAAITSITLALSSGNFAQYTIVTLYGVL